MPELNFASHDRLPPRTHVQEQVHDGEKPRIVQQGKLANVLHQKAPELGTGALCIATRPASAQSNLRPPRRARRGFKLKPQATAPIDLNVHGVSCTTSFIGLSSNETSVVLEPSVGPSNNSSIYLESIPGPSQRVWPVLPPPQVCAPDFPIVERPQTRRRQRKERPKTVGGEELPPPAACEVLQTSPTMQESPARAASAQESKRRPGNHKPLTRRHKRLLERTRLLRRLEGMGLLAGNVCKWSRADCGKFFRLLGFTEDIADKIAQSVNGTQLIELHGGHLAHLHIAEHKKQVPILKAIKLLRALAVMPEALDVAEEDARRQLEADIEEAALAASDPIDESRFGTVHVQDLHIEPSVLTDAVMASLTVEDVNHPLRIPNRTAKDDEIRAGSPSGERTTIGDVVKSVSKLALRVHGAPDTDNVPETKLSHALPFRTRT